MSIPDDTVPIHPNDERFSNQVLVGKKTPETAVPTVVTIVPKHEIMAIGDDHIDAWTPTVRTDQNLVFPVIQRLYPGIQALLRIFTIRGIEACAERGFQQTGFFEVDTKEEPDWTVSLSGSPTKPQSGG